MPGEGTLANVYVKQRPWLTELVVDYCYNRQLTDV